MKLPNCFLSASVSILSLAMTFSVATSASAQATSSLFAHAQSVTDANPSQAIQATVWLNLHNKQSFDQVVAGLYQQGSPTYHHWLKPADLARYMPTKSDIQTVRQQLAENGLIVLSTGPNNAYLKVSGTVADMQSAFQTHIKSLVVNGKPMRAAVEAPKLSGSAGSLVASVSGLTDSLLSFQHIRATDPATGQPYAVPVSSNGIFFSSGCFRGAQAQVFKTPGASLPVATYIGNRYGANIANTTLGTLAPCGYDVANFTTAYGMNAAYREGLDGAGQTIVIVDAYEQPTIQADANTFSSLNGLPALTSSNFQIIYPVGAPTTTNLNSTEETSLDVEWAHAVAPGANIDLLLAPNLSFAAVEDSVYYAIINQLGSVISNSYGAPEALVDPQDIATENFLSELGASVGISVNYSSGDYGDDVQAYGVKSVATPADSPYSTAVGGTTLAINPDNNRMLFQTGWGNNLTQIDATTGPLAPPAADGFYAGSGGGESADFAKPDWQRDLRGTGRQVPDVSLDADPFTGVEVVLTIGGTQEVGVIGGTSLACPAFSAIWAIANQRAAQFHRPGTLLGQAAPIVARLQHTAALEDIAAYGSPANVTGLVITKQGTSFYAPNRLVEPLQNTTRYLSALFNDTTSVWFTLSFGTDSSLVVGPGWDNVTGYGTPNGLTFINEAAR